MTRRKALWIVGIIIAFGIGLRVYQLGLRSIWFDEAFTWRLIRFSWVEMVQRAALDVHPPLFYVLIKLWSIVFGASIVSLRSFSVAMSALTMAGAYLFTARVCRQRSAGVIAAALVAASGWHIAYSWEARMYTLGTALAFLSSYLLLRAIEEKKRSLPWWVAYGVAAAAFAYTHYYAFFSLAAQGLFVIGLIAVQTRGRIGEMLQSKVLGGALVSVVVASLLFAPWLPTFLHQNAQVHASFWIPPTTSWSVPETFYRMLLPTAGGIDHSGWHVFLAVAPLSLMVLVSLVLLGARTPGAWLTVLSIFTPFLLSVLLSLRSQSLYQDRYFIFAFVYFLSALAAFASVIPHAVIRRSLVAIMVTVFLGASIHYGQELNIAGHPGVHAAARHIYQTAPTEKVLVSSSFIYFSVEHYALEEFHAANPLLYSENGELAHFAGGPILTADDVAGRQLFTQPDLRAMWLVDTTGFGSSPLPIPKEWKVTNTASYPEVFGYQGDIIVCHLER